MISVAVVDDHDLFRETLEAFITKNPEYTVFSGAKNGKEFLDRLAPENLPDIVIMDIIMPVMDGYETTKVLKSAYPSIRVLAISIFDNEDKVEKILSCGAIGFVQKSADSFVFLEAISAVYQNKEYINIQL